MEKVKYKLYVPSGNKTALVIGDWYTKAQKKHINDFILYKHKSVEQVGFVSEKEYKLTMAGGEFCGNATRCAALYYLGENKNRNISIKVSGMTDKVKAGIDKNSNVYADIKVNSVKKYKGYKIIEIEGITHIVLNENESEKYLCDLTNIKEKAREIIDNLKVDDKAVGVIFTEETDKALKIFPIVLVKSIDTLFFETACGSGTVATLMAFDEEKLDILQPSGFIINAQKVEKNSARILGIVQYEAEYEEEIL
ncbi:MAG: hypothetical protein IJS47_00835 [Clostridia bacterium]|nr:hypothetical protein [Clostridia bacterium]